MTVYFDIEATGLPIEDHTDWSTARLVQLAWIIVDDNGQLVTEESYLISDDSYSSSEEALSVHHIEDSYRNEHGVDGRFVLRMFIRQCSQCNVIVFHSGIFDVGVLYNECLIRNINMTPIYHLFTYNTKKSNLYVKHSPNNLATVVSIIDPEYAPPTTSQPHDALYDTYLCKRLYELTRPRQLKYHLSGLIDYIERVRNGLFRK